MKRFGKITAVLLMAVMVFSLAGCKKTETTTSGTQYKDNDEFYTIEWYYINPDVKQNDVLPIQNKLNEYLKKKINAEVHMNVLDWATYSQRIKLMLQTNEKIDLMWSKGGEYSSYSAKKAFLPINDLMEEYAPKLTKTIDKNLLKGSQIKGVNYGIPANKEAAHALGCIYRKDIADALNIDMESMKSPDDIIKTFDSIKKAYPDVYPLLMGAASAPNNWDTDFSSLYGPFVQKKGSKEIVNIYETDEYKDACNLAYDMLQKGYAQNEIGKTEDDLIREGKFFCMITNLKPGKAEEYNTKFNNKERELAQVILNDPISTTSDCTGSIMSITRTSKNPARVMKFLELLNTDEYVNNLINYGIEGDGYIKNSNGSVHVNQDAKYRNTGTNWMMGNVFINYITETEDPQKNENFKKFNSEAKPSELLGFNFDIEPVKNQAIAVSNVITEYNDQFRFGKVKLSVSHKEFIEKMKSAGLDKVYEEVSKQYKDWKKNN